MFSYTLGCNGLALMLGYTNPWATLLRKQCEATPVAVQGVYDLALALLVDVPFAKCMCVDAASRGSNFQRYAMDNCYFFAPTHLKPTILGLIENAALGGSSESIREACLAMVQFAKDGLTASMQPWFDAQFSSTQALASSVDYVLSFTDGIGTMNGVAGNAGRWVFTVLHGSYDARASGTRWMDQPPTTSWLQCFVEHISICVDVCIYSCVLRPVRFTVPSTESQYQICSPWYSYAGDLKGVIPIIAYEPSLYAWQPSCR